MRVAAGVLVKNPNDPSLFLSFKRKKSEGGGASLPCGKSDEGEAPHQTAQRECLEETGWTIFLHMLHPFVAYDEKDGYQVWIFSGDLDEEEYKISPAFPDEGEVCWATAQDLIDGPYGEFNRQALAHFGIITTN